MCSSGSSSSSPEPGGVRGGVGAIYHGVGCRHGAAPSQPIIATRVVAGAHNSKTCLSSHFERNQRASGASPGIFARFFLLAAPSRAGLTRGAPRPADGRRDRARDLAVIRWGRGESRARPRLASHVRLCGSRQSMCVRGWGWVLWRRQATAEVDPLGWWLPLRALIPCSFGRKKWFPLFE